MTADEVTLKLRNGGEIRGSAADIQFVAHHLYSMGVELPGAATAAGVDEGARDSVMLSGLGGNKQP